MMAGNVDLDALSDEKGKRLILEIVK